MIEIRGQNGEITSARYLEFNGAAPGEWSWGSITTIDVKAANDAKQIEIQAAVQPLEVYFHVVDWSGENEDHCDGQVILDGPVPVFSGTREIDDGTNLLSNPGFEEHIHAVETILSELELGTIPRFLVFNKEDRVDSSYTRRSCRRYNAIAISALKGRNLDSLLSTIEGMLWKDMDSIGELDIDTTQTRS